jgi:excisionase family DNA binding protein
MMEEMLQGYITTTQAAERAGIDVSQIRRMVDTGKIRGVKAGRNWLAEIESLDYYAANYGWYHARRHKKKTANK